MIFFSQYNFIENTENTNYKNYINYSISTSYYIKKLQTTISYINSGSTVSFVDEYRSIIFSCLYNITNSIYLKSSYNKSILNNDNNIAFSLGYNYE